MTNFTLNIFSKFEMTGGSELRCVELANAVNNYTDIKARILCECGLSRRLLDFVSAKTEVVENVFLPEPKNIEFLYDAKWLLVVNTDCPDFSTLDYWEGRSKRHSCFVDISKIQSMIFLYNFIVSPSRSLSSILPKCPNIKILVANKKFFNEIGESKYNNVCFLPRLFLESPIDICKIKKEKIESSIVRIGRHSKTLSSKFNDQTIDVISAVNKMHPGAVSWDFMGVPDDRQKELIKIDNVNIRKEFSKDVPEYLQEIDIFLFFPSWSREEPWSRCVAEGLASGCPVITTSRGGNKDQVINGNNGFLCDSVDDFIRSIDLLVSDRRYIDYFGQNGSLYSVFFSSEYIANKLVKFLEADKERKILTMEPDTSSIQGKKPDAIDSRIIIHNDRWKLGVSKTKGLNWFKLFDLTGSEESWVSKGFLDFFTHLLPSDVMSLINRPLHKLSCLEIGVGGGRLALPASHVFKNVYGVDIHDNLDKTGEWLKKRGCKNVVLTQDMSSIPDSSIDFVFSYLVFQHFYHESQVIEYLNEIKRVLSPTGVCSICYAHLDPLDIDDIWRRGKEGNVGVVSLRIKQHIMSGYIKSAGLNEYFSRVLKKYPWSKMEKDGGQTMAVLSGEKK